MSISQRFYEALQTSNRTDIQKPAHVWPVFENTEIYRSLFDVSSHIDITDNTMRNPVHMGTAGLANLSFATIHPTSLPELVLTFDANENQSIFWNAFATHTKLHSTLATFVDYFVSSLKIEGGNYKTILWEQPHTPPIPLRSVMGCQDKWHRGIYKEILPFQVENHFQAWRRLVMDGRVASVVMDITNPSHVSNVASALATISGQIRTLYTSNIPDFLHPDEVDFYQRPNDIKTLEKMGENITTLACPHTLLINHSSKKIPTPVKTTNSFAR